MRITLKDCEELVERLDALNAFALIKRKETRKDEPERTVDVVPCDARVGGYKIRAVNHRGGYTTLFSGSPREVYAWLSGVAFLSDALNTNG